MKGNYTSRFLQNVRNRNTRTYKYFISIIYTLNKIIITSQSLSFNRLSSFLLVINCIEPQVGPVRDRGVLQILFSCERSGDHHVRGAQHGAPQPGSVVRLSWRLVDFEIGYFQVLIVGGRQKTFHFLVKPRLKAGQH